MSGPGAVVSVHGGGVVAGNLNSGSSTAVEGGGSQSGTLMTPHGSITWTRASDGSLAAEGGGQKLAANGHDESDGSWQKHATYARTSKAPYLSMESVGKVAEHNVEFTLSAGSSRLTLTVANIDVLVTSGTATLSGTWKGVAVHWTGHVDLTSNPLVGRPIAGWPTSAFAAELEETAFFAPLGNALARKLSPVPVGTGGGTHAGGGTHQIESAKGVLGRAGAWCAGGALAAAGAGPETLGGAVVLGCAGGVVASLLNDLVTWADEDGPQVDPLPPIDLPDDPEPTGPVTQTQPDDDPPPAPDDTGGGGGGGGGKLKDAGDPELEEE
jgi:hypothetical protein